MANIYFYAEEGMLQGRHMSSHPRLRLDDKHKEFFKTGHKMLDNASFKSWRGYDM